MPHSIPFHVVIASRKCVWPSFIYHRVSFEIRHPTIPFAFPSPGGLEALQPTTEQSLKLQTAMIHPFSFMERDSHPESIYELLELKVDRALIGTLSTSSPQFRFANPFARSHDRRRNI